MTYHTESALIDESMNNHKFNDRNVHPLTINYRSKSDHHIRLKSKCVV